MRLRGCHICRNKSRMRKPRWSCAPAKTAARCHSRLGFESLEERLVLSHSQMAAPPDDGGAASHIATPVDSGSPHGGSGQQTTLANGASDNSGAAPATPRPAIPPTLHPEIRADLSAGHRPPTAGWATATRTTATRTTATRATGAAVPRTVRPPARRRARRTTATIPRRLKRPAGTPPARPVETEMHLIRPAPTPTARPAETIPRSSAAIVMARRAAMAAVGRTATPPAILPAAMAIKTRVGTRPAPLVGQTQAVPGQMVPARAPEMATTHRVTIPQARGAETAPSPLAEFRRVRPAATAPARPA